MAIRTTSIGISTINFPFKLNMIMIVNSNEINVIGEINGIYLVSNHSIPFVAIKPYRLIIPSANGIPKYMPTLSAI